MNHAIEVLSKELEKDKGIKENVKAIAGMAQTQEERESAVWMEFRVNERIRSLVKGIDALKAREEERLDEKRTEILDSIVKDCGKYRCDYKGERYIALSKTDIVSAIMAKEKENR